jgi:GrpB-like predicted nucleotidyltransferase (UPF0157 family)
VPNRSSTCRCQSRRFSQFGVRWTPFKPSNTFTCLIPTTRFSILPSAFPVASASPRSRPRSRRRKNGEHRRFATISATMTLIIDHHGSTSIPGLGAKPIIDIQVSVAALQPMSSYGGRLQAIGYVHVPHPDDSFCPFFHRPPQWPHSHHVHLVEAGGAEERRTLAFRDYLRDHADAAREYEHLKQDLARQFVATNPESREAYARAKTDFIERVAAMALSSGYPREFHQGESGVPAADKRT